MKRKRSIAGLSPRKHRPTREQHEMVKRRIEPFLDHGSVENRSLSFLLCEAYVQGMRDAVDVLEMTEKTNV